MPSDVALSVESLTKTYRIAHAPKAGSLSEALTHTLKRRVHAERPDVELFHALRDISFEVGRGDVLGVIGRNGAGKSTLLKILSRITEPTSGQVKLYGRVGALLEVGAGFHPELTGRENVFLNGAILGLRRKQIRALFDEIVDFAEVERFIDTPVKRYSSGMYVRLAFAVAAFVLPEILIVDEVLAVGDSAFQKKCLGRMGEAASEGRTVLFVAHNMQVVNALCKTGIYLRNGEIAQRGSIGDVIGAYNASMGDGQARTLAFQPWFPDLGVRRISVDQDHDAGALLSTEDTQIAVHVTLSGIERKELVVGFTLLDTYGNPILSSFWDDLDLEPGTGTISGDQVFTATIPANTLNEGTHRLRVDFGVHKTRTASDDSHALEFDIVNVDGVGARFGLGRAGRDTPLAAFLPWTVHNELTAGA